MPSYKELYDLTGRIDSELNLVLGDVTRLGKTLGGDVGFSDAFLKYISALEKSTLLLEGIVGRLKLKTDGQRYNLSEYNKNVKEYEIVVAQYMELGKKLNEFERMHNSLPKSFLNFLEETIDVIIKEWKKKKISMEIINQFKYSIFSEE